MPIFNEFFKQVLLQISDFSLNKTTIQLTSHLQKYWGFFGGDFVLGFLLVVVLAVVFFTEI